MLFPALVVLYFGPAMLQGYMLAPGDGLAQYFYERVLAAEALKAGEMPFWNPFHFGGTPFLATIQPGVFFPGNWTFFVLPPVAAMNVAVLLTYVWAGWGVIALCRALALPRSAALLAATIFVFGGFMAYHVEAITMIQAASFLPWLLFVIERYRQDLRLRYPVAGALLVALMLFAGHPQMAAYSLLVAGAYTLFRAVSLGRAAWPYLFHLGLMVAIGVGLALVQLLPTLDLIPMTQRQSISYERLVRSSLDWLALPGFLAPFLFGTRRTDSLIATPLWGPDPWLGAQHGYVGPVALILAAGALLLWRRESQVRFWGALAVVAFVLALGGNTPLYRAWALLPVVNTMPYASRHLLEFDLAVAMLAAFAVAGAGVWLKRWWLAALPVVGSLGVLLVAVVAVGPGFAERSGPYMPPGVDLSAALSLTSPAVWLPLLLVAVTCLWLAWRRPGPAWRGGLIALVAFDLFLYGAYMGRYLDGKVMPADYASSPRVTSAPYQGRTLAIANVSYPFFEPLPYLEKLRYPGLSTVQGARMINGYDAFIMQRLASLTGMESLGHLANPAVWQPGHHVLDLLGMTELRLDAGLAETPAWRERLASPRFGKVRREGEVVVAENRQALPRAWRPARVTLLAKAEVDRRLTADPGFRALEEALVEAPLAGDAWTGGVATLETRSVNRLRLETEGPGPGLVVLSEGYDPGWRATAHGESLPVHRVDGLLIGVEVPPGAQIVELNYEPRLWRAGLAGSGLASLALIAWGYLGRKRKRGWQR